MLTPLNRALVVLNLAIVGLGCYGDGDDLKGKDAPSWTRPPDIHGSPTDAGVPAAQAPAVEVRSSALWVNPPAGACTGEQPGNTVRLRPSSTSSQCLQFGANVEITNLGFYTWPDGSAILNDTVNYALGDVHGMLNKTQRVTLWWDINFQGQSWWQQRQYTGGPGGGWNVWLIAPDNLPWWTASSLRYETW